MKYIFFDLDGTLCESKQLVEIPIIRELEILNSTYKVIIVSGAEFSRMLIQAPMHFITYMAQNGNETWDNGNLLWNNVFTEREKVLEHINLVAKEMKVEITEDMIDDRGCQISFSFVGHHSPLEIKKKFDPDRKKRIALLEKYPYHNAVIGGTTCLDYIPFTKGENILKYIRLRKIRPAECVYVGDAFMNYGNDSTVVGVIPTFQVKSPLETLKFIKQYDCRNLPSR